jgi:hypothetical protein
MKLKLNGHLFDTIEEIQAETQKVLDTDRKWRSRWDWCLHSGGNYFEGDGGR